MELEHSKKEEVCCIYVAGIRITTYCERVFVYPSLSPRVHPSLSHFVCSSQDREEFFEKLDEGCDLMKLVVALSDVPTAQGKAFKLSLLPKPVIVAGKELPKRLAQIKFETAMDKFKWHLRSVEISWNKRIERVYFVLPGSCRYFLESARNRVKQGTDFSSEDRIKPFLARTRDLDDEMRWIQRLNESNLYRYVGARLDQLKKWSYIMALLMNFVMLISLQYFPGNSRTWYPGTPGYNSSHMYLV
jgi:hypothetical protein